MIQCLSSTSNFKSYNLESQVSCMVVSKMISCMQQHFTDRNNLLITPFIIVPSKSSTPAAVQLHKIAFISSWFSTIGWTGMVFSSCLAHHVWVAPLGWLRSTPVYVPSKSVHSSLWIPYLWLRPSVPAATGWENLLSYVGASCRTIKGGGNH